MREAEISYTVSGSIFGYDSRVEMEGGLSYSGGLTALESVLNALQEIVEVNQK